MASKTTKLSNIINPEVMRGIIEAKIEAHTWIQDAVGHHDNLIVKALNDWFEQLFAIFEEWFPEFKGQLVLDTGALIGEIAPKMDTELGKIMNYKGRGNG